MACRDFARHDTVQSFGGRLVTAKDFRRIALSLPDTAEGSHFGHADFRRSERIFATLSGEKQGFGVLLLTPEQQSGMVQDEPEMFSPVPGGWGLKGSTRVFLANVTEDILQSALRTAWLGKAPKPKAASRTRAARKSPGPS